MSAFWTVTGVTTSKVMPGRRDDVSRAAHRVEGDRIISYTYVTWYWSPCRSWENCLYMTFIFCVFLVYFLIHVQLFIFRKLSHLFLYKVSSESHIFLTRDFFYLAQTRIHPPLLYPFTQGMIEKEDWNLTFKCSLNAINNTVVANIQLSIIFYSNHVLWNHHEHWIIKYWSITPRWNMGLSSSKSLITIFSLTKKFMTLVLCVFL